LIYTTTARYLIAVSFSTIAVSCLMMAVEQNTKQLIRSEIHNSGTVNLLVLKEFVNQFTMHGMKNVKITPANCNHALISIPGMTLMQAVGCTPLMKVMQRSNIIQIILIHNQNVLIQFQILIP
jgi:hypothetical protein